MRGYGISQVLVDRSQLQSRSCEITAHYNPRVSDFSQTNMPLNSSNEGSLLSSWFVEHGMSLCGSNKVDSRSVFLVVKEIVDNAIDACRSPKGNSNLITPNTTVIFAAYYELSRGSPSKLARKRSLSDNRRAAWSDSTTVPSDPLSRTKVSVVLRDDHKFICSDFGGPGIAAHSVDSIRNMFSSTKSADRGKSSADMASWCSSDVRLSGFSGRFGLGLKFVILFLHQAGCGAIQYVIIENTLTMEVWSFIAFSFEVVTEEARLVEFDLLVEAGDIRLGEVKVEISSEDPGFTTRVSGL